MNALLQFNCSIGPVQSFTSMMDRKVGKQEAAIEQRDSGRANAEVFCRVVTEERWGGMRIPRLQYFSHDLSLLFALPEVSNSAAARGLGSLLWSILRRVVPHKDECVFIGVLRACLSLLAAAENQVTALNCIRFPSRVTVTPKGTIMAGHYGF